MEYKSQILNEDKFKGNYIGTGGIILKGIFDVFCEGFPINP